MTEVMNVQAAKTHFSQLLSRVERGEQIVIARGGRPIAKLSAVEPPAERELGFVAGAVPDDFDAPLPDDELDAWN